MRRRQLVQISALAAILCILTARGAAQQPPAQQPPAQQPSGPLGGPEYTRLGFLAGTWEEEITYAGAETAAGRARWVARPALGFILILNYEGSGPEGAYRAHGVLTYDREAKVYRMWWFDDSGGIGDYRGNFTDANTLVLEHGAKKEGREFRERISYIRLATGVVRTKIEQAWDAEDFKPYLEAVARRVAGGLARPGQAPRPMVPPPQ
jgi:hypothetical protein